MVTAMASGGRKRWLWVGAIAIVVLAVAWMGRGALHRDPKAPAVQVEAVAKRDIEVTVEATGTVEPIDLVEVKSKASGQILRMPVQVGSVVRAGDLLAQIDKVDVQNQYDQARAALQAAQAKVDVSRAQKQRADTLFSGGVITAPEHESATLDFAGAQAALVKARTDLDTARQRLADATVRAPIEGTVLQQPVAVGQVISSATSSVSGGTTLLQMADLRRIRVRVLVSETDIGSVHPGQVAAVSVDAYPQRSFQGQVEKIEPQAVVDQSVTMFPVLVSLSNDDGLLLPGMNGEVTMQVALRPGVLSVSTDALRTLREVGAIATALGLNPDSVSAQIARQREVRMAARGDSARAGGAAARRSSGSGGGFAASATDSAGRRGGRGGGRSGRGGWAGGGAGASASNGGGGGGSGGGGASGRGGAAARVVFVKTAKGLEPRLIRIGVSNFDYAQVLDGLAEGDQVALLSVAELQAQRGQDMARIRQRVGGGLPGVGGGGGGGPGGATRRGGS